MRNSTLGIVIVLLMAFGMFFGAALAEDKVPTLPKGTQVQLQLLLTQRSLVQEKAARAQLEYEKAVRDLQTQFDKVSNDLEVAVKAAYTDAKVDTKDYELDVEKGAFVVKAKAAAEKGGK